MTQRDVTAVVLTIGEPYLARALDSLARQTLPPVDVVRVEHVTPFHRALNAGMARVQSEFFVHVDADMVLDPTAVADLRACAAPGVGAVVGGLRDALRGSIVGVKLYRTAAAAAQPCPDSITPAADFLAALRGRGWLTAHALRYRPGPRALWHTFGEHQPDYSPLYTFTKFRILGARYRRWRHGPSLRRMFAVLHASRHAAAPIAQAAAASGVFWDESRDVLRPCAPSAELALLQRLILGRGAARRGPPPPGARVAATPREAFLDHCRLGCALAQTGDGAAFRARFAALAGAAPYTAWVALVGLCHGLFLPAFDAARAEADFRALAAVFPDGECA